MEQKSNPVELLAAAASVGTLSQTAQNTLANIPDIGTQIQEALGMPADQFTPSEAVLVSIMPDDSGSIRFAGNAEAVRDGHNMVINALLDSKQGSHILFHTRYLNGKVLNPYQLLEQADRMDSGNYNPNQGTPLYDQTAVLLGTILAKTQEFSDNGLPVRSITAIVTDGDDIHSTNQSASSVRKIVEDMLKTEQHIIAGMGIWDGENDSNGDPIPGTGTDFEEVFRNMGIPDEWILTPSNSESEIRKAFQVFSQSAVRASQTAASFSQTALSGFGAPTTP